MFSDTFRFAVYETSWGFLFACVRAIGLLSPCVRDLQLPANALEVSCSRGIVPRLQL